MNDGAPVVTLASTLRLVLPQAVERKRSEARLFPEVKGHASLIVVAPATAMPQRCPAPSSQSPAPSEGPRHLPALPFYPFRCAFAFRGERLHPGPPLQHRAPVARPGPPSHTQTQVCPALLGQCSLPSANDPPPSRSRRRCLAFALCSEQPHLDHLTSHRGATTAPGSPLAVSRPRRWLASPPRTIPRSSSICGGPPQ
ncbi:hypothetical protein BKA93DRAFT_111730 [Sparassis latifolia]